MLTNLFSFIKKDLHMMISGKFFILSLSSLIIYSCYISFYYANINVAPLQIYVYDETQRIKTFDNLSLLSSYETLENAIKNNEDALGVHVTNESYNILQYDSGSNLLNTFKYSYVISHLNHNIDISEPKTLTTITRSDKLRREMSCEVLFFEIAAIGFLGVAALLFKEKSFGTIKIHAILPFNKSLFIISKIIVFLINDILFSFLLVLVNLFNYKPSSLFFPLMLQVIILSAFMTLIGFYFAAIFDNIKQFTFAYLFISLCMITPVFLAANTSLSWSWIKYYPIYYLYMGIKNAFFGLFSSPLYYIICIVVLVLLFILDYKKFMIIIKE